MGRHLVGLEDGERWMIGCDVYLCILLYIYPESDDRATLDVFQRSLHESGVDFSFKSNVPK